MEYYIDEYVEVHNQHCKIIGKKLVNGEVLYRARANDKCGTIYFNLQYNEIKPWTRKMTLWEKIKDYWYSETREEELQRLLAEAFEAVTERIQKVNNYGTKNV